MQENYSIKNISTDDNFNLFIRRYKPSDKDISKYPVVLSHGLLSNKNSLDFGEANSKEWNDYSLASYLLKGGKDNDLKFDVWVPELRGLRTYNKQDPERYKRIINHVHWGLDEYVDYDVPSIINKIHEEYGFKTPILWVGMSMGGMIAYAHGETDRGFKDFKGVVTIGSPVSFEYNEGLVFRLAGALAPRRKFVYVNLKKFIETNAAVKKILIDKVSNNENIDIDILKRFIDIGFDNTISSKILSHFGVFFRHQDMCRFPKYPWAWDIEDKMPIIKDKKGPFSWKENLNKFKTPILAIAGGADEEAPPGEVKYVLENVGSSDKTYEEFSISSKNTDIDYGHLDFHKGINAKNEVYPVIYEWLKRKNDS